MGFAGEYLTVNLSTETSRRYNLDMDLAEKYIGGKGLGAKYLFDNLRGEEDPLGPKNLILFLTGPLSGTSIQTSGRWCITTKSPQTGLFTDSHIGGKFGFNLKKAGFDFILVQGISDSPCYVHVSNKEVEIFDATDLWGKGTFETESTLKKRHPKSEITSIGPAGENLVSYACALTDKTHIAGRGGVGAVMGSKRLKALVVEGDNLIKVADSKKFNRLVKEFNKKVLENPAVKLRHDLGTPMWVRMSNEAGFLPTRNFQSGVFESAELISGERMKNDFVIGHTACYRCGIACGKTTRFVTGHYDGLQVDGPEYETIALLGSNCGIDNLGAIAKSSQLCDDLGLDTISTGGSIAFALEASEKGILRQTDVVDLKFGNETAVHTLIELIANRQGIGELLSEGSFAAAIELGEDSSNFAIQVKELELPGVEPRGSWGMALAYSTADRGGCHQRCWTPSAELGGAIPRLDMKGVPRYVKEVQDERAVCFSLVVCDFLPFEVTEMTELLNAATGFTFTPQSYLTTGERIWNLTRLFNIREGLSGADDILPKRFHQEKAPAGFAKGKLIKQTVLDEAKREYYRIRGWNKKGIPTKEKLQSLGISSIH